MGLPDGITGGEVPGNPGQAVPGDHDWVLQVAGAAPRRTPAGCWSHPSSRRRRQTGGGSSLKLKPLPQVVVQSIGSTTTFKGMIESYDWKYIVCQNKSSLIGLNVISIVCRHMLRFDELIGLVRKKKFLAEEQVSIARLRVHVLGCLSC